MATSNNVIKGICILQKYVNGDEFFLCAEHDSIYIHVDHDSPTLEEQNILESLGFNKDEAGGWAVSV